MSVCAIGRILLRGECASLRMLLGAALHGCYWAQPCTGVIGRSLARVLLGAALHGCYWAQPCTGARGELRTVVAEWGRCNVRGWRGHSLHGAHVLEEHVHACTPVARSLGVAAEVRDDALDARCIADCSRLVLHELGRMLGRMLGGYKVGLPGCLCRVKVRGVCRTPQMPRLVLAPADAAPVACICCTQILPRERLLVRAHPHHNCQ